MPIQNSPYQAFAALLSTSGQAHEQTFLVECRIDPLKVVTQGRGKSRKAAEQAAAQAALERLRVE